MKLAEEYRMYPKTKKEKYKERGRCMKPLIEQEIASVFLCINILITVLDRKFICKKQRIITLIRRKLVYINCYL